jgi:hypothetical protein
MVVISTYFRLNRLSGKCQYSTYPQGHTGPACKKLQAQAGAGLKEKTVTSYECVTLETIESIRAWVNDRCMPADQIRGKMTRCR